MARAMNQGERLHGAALHPGERACVRCGRRIDDLDRCEWARHDATEHTDRFRHVRCPSPYLPPASPLARAVFQAQATLVRARAAYGAARRIREPWRTVLRAELEEFGHALKGASERDSRLVVAALVLGFKQWEKAHGEALGARGEEREDPPGG